MQSKGLLLIVLAAFAVLPACRGKHKCVCVDNATGDEVFDSGPKLSKEEAFATCDDEYGENPDLTCTLWEGG